MMPRPSAPILRPMVPADLEGALRLSHEAGWPHRAEDWALLMEIGEGFVAAGPDGEVLGTAMRSAFGPVSMANMIIVAQALRGQGIGRRLLQAVLSLAPDSEWRLVATPDGLPLYQSLGFVATGIVRQYQGVVPADLAGDPPAAPAARWIAPPDAGTLDRLIALDHEATGAGRRPLFEALGRRARLAVLPAKDPGGIAAFGLLRPFGRGLALAPLIAQDAEAAADILRLAAHAAAGGFLRVDTIAAPGAECPLAGALAATRLPCVSSGTEMTRPAPAATPPAPTPPAPSRNFHRFALAAQALG